MGCKEVDTTKDLYKTSLYIRLLVVLISFTIIPSWLLRRRRDVKIQKLGLSKTLCLCCEDAREIRHLLRNVSAFCWGH